jgi:hypothetical protein
VWRPPRRPAGLSRAWLSVIGAAAGIAVEISYNASVTGNTFVGNAIKGGEGNAGFPTGAIYISESGGDAAVPSTFAGQLNIAGNVFQDNWSGVVIYQNSNRYTGDGQDPGTLTPPSGTSVNDWINNADKTCPSHLSQTSPVNYNALCQWRSQNVTVQNNTFQFNPSDSIYGGQCTQAHSCGQNALFAVYSDTSAYPKWTVCNNISNNQNNHFTNNTYTGPWSFVYFNQGDTVGASAWQAGVNNVEGADWLGLVPATPTAPMSRPMTGKARHMRTYICVPMLLLSSCWYRASALRCWPS